MRLLDRYVLGSFAKGFVGALLIFTVMIVSIDFFSRVGHFLDADKVEGTFAEGYSRTRLIFEFYAVYLPFLLKEMLPFVTVFAGLLTVTSMLQNNEVFPVVAAGVSTRRLFVPLILCGLLVSLGHLAFQEYVVPSLGRRQLALKRFFQGDRATGVDDLVHLRDGKGTVTRAGNFRFGDGALVDVVVQRPWKESGFERWRVPLLRPAGDTWTAPEGLEVQPAGVDELPRRLPVGAAVDIGVTPAEVEALASKKGTDELSFTQLGRLVAKFPERRHLRVAWHKQAARPLSSFVLLLCGVPILLATGRSYFM
ncbi:MAG: LptF/LptG family permease, partial [Planctomycetota bacterium]|nr:LptF/LptG family permease [Planctomycetota bacterium]